MSNIIKKMRIGLLSLVLAAFVSIGFSVPTAFAVGEGAKDAACSSIGGCDNVQGTSVNGIIRIVVNIISMVAGLIAVIMIIVAGMKYITSGGDSSKVASAKNALLYAIIGLVIVALAQVIVRFVLRSATKTPEQIQQEQQAANETGFRILPGGAAYKINA